MTDARRLSLSVSLSLLFILIYSHRIPQIENELKKNKITKRMNRIALSLSVIVHCRNEQ